MKVSSPRSTENQPLLFDNDIFLLQKNDEGSFEHNLGLIRTYVGSIAEQLAWDQFGGERLKTDASCDICPDLKFSDSSYAEVKSSGKNRQIILYEERVKKYNSFIEQGNRLIYIIYHHDVDWRQVNYLEELKALYKKSIKAILILDASSLHKEIQSLPTRIVNGAHDNPTYKMGWTVNINRLIKHLTTVRRIK